MTVAELIFHLSSYPRNAEVKGTFEGVVREIDGIYCAKSGTVIVDVDRCDYQEEFESGKRHA